MVIYGCSRVHCDFYNTGGSSGITSCDRITTDMGRRSARRLARRRCSQAASASPASLTSPKRGDSANSRGYMTSETECTPSPQIRRSTIKMVDAQALVGYTRPRANPVQAPQLPRRKRHQVSRGLRERATRSLSHSHCPVESRGGRRHQGQFSSQRHGPVSWQAYQAAGHLQGAHL